jgi:ABC-2 type transport system ATP-binding protein
MLRLSSIHKVYGSTVAVDGLSLDVPKGCVFGLLGPNGAGKTTTINICVGTVRPSSGSVDLDGRGSPDDPAVRTLIGVAPQTIALYDSLTARENLRLFGKLYGVDRGVLPGRVDDLLEQVGLRERGDDRVGGYSGGMKRRLNMVAALVHDPPLVMLDEPTAGVDPQSRSAIMEAVRGLRDAGKTVVYTTHYMEEAQRLCDEVAIMDHGRILAQGPVDTLIKAHGGQTVVTIQSTTGDTRIQTSDPVSELSRHLTSEGVLNVRVERPDLESVFLNLTGRTLRD